MEASGSVAGLTTNAGAATRFRLKGYNCNCSTGAAVTASTTQVRFLSIGNKYLKYASSGAQLSFSSTASSSTTWLLDAP
jgi:hypothetical protein